MPPTPFDLAASAQQEMIRGGFTLQSEPACAQQIADLRSRPAPVEAKDVRDLRGLPWSSIDNDSSRDLDQAEVADREESGTRVRIAIADVAVMVEKDSPLDRFAAAQTQTVYTAVRNFPMLPTVLSTDLTSLNEGAERRAVVTEFLVSEDGAVGGSAIYAATVRNGAQLAYGTVGRWIEGAAGGTAEGTAEAAGKATAEGTGEAAGKAAATAKIAGSAALEEQLRMQAGAATSMHRRRLAEGALDFTRIEADPLVVDGQVVAVGVAQRNRATELIEEFMIAANGVMARTLLAAGRSSLRRVVKSPERWPRMVELARRYGVELPGEADSAALNAFLVKRKALDPDRYPELALSVIKLMGPGQYVLSRAADAQQEGHFGLAARDYTHSTAPNRRYADLVTQRIVKAMLAGETAPYADEELAAIAAHCNEREAAARKVERAMQKREAAVALAGQVGVSFRGIVTGASDKGTYVRVFEPPVEGRVIEGEKGLDVGDPVQVTLVRTDPQRAFIDFKRG